MVLKTTAMCRMLIIIAIVLLLANCTSAPPIPEKTQIRWFTGLELGASPEQIAALNEVVADFNISQDQIELTLQVTTAGGAYDTLASQFATQQGPDIVGPISWGTANNFYGQWFNLDPYIQNSNFDLAPYNPALIDFYKTDQGQLALPFAVSPSAIYYVPAVFDEAGLEYPPQVYGEKYRLDDQLVDWSWATLSEVAKRLTIDANGFNATQPEFDRKHIDQVGLALEGQNALSIASFFGAAKIYQGTAGSYSSAIPLAWQTPGGGNTLPCGAHSLSWQPALSPIRLSLAKAIYSTPGNPRWR